MWNVNSYNSVENTLKDKCMESFKLSINTAYLYLTFINWSQKSISKEVLPLYLYIIYIGLLDI